VSTGRVEVTEQGTVPLLSLVRVASLGGVVSLGVDKIRDGSLNSKLGVSVRVGRTKRALLWDRDHVRDASGIAVHGGGARKDDVVDIVLLHGTEQVDRAIDVDVVVVEGLLTRLTDRLSRTISCQHVDAKTECRESYLQGCKVDDAVNVGVRSKHLVEAGRVGDVDLEEVGSLARDQFNAVDDLWGRVEQIVGNDNLVVSLQESKGREGANIARSSVVV
jgi:hypothetical protein